MRPAVHRAPRGHDQACGLHQHQAVAADLSLTVVDDLEAAVAVANDSPFGLSAAVFTPVAAFERCADDLRVGVLHWNRSSAGASGTCPLAASRPAATTAPAGIVMGASSCTRWVCAPGDDQRPTALVARACGSSRDATPAASVGGLTVAALAVIVAFTVQVRVDDVWWHLGAGELVQSPLVPCTHHQSLQFHCPR